MAVIGKVELEANQDVKAGGETSIYDLFTFEERSKKFTVEQYIRRDETRLKIHVSKLGVVDTVSDSNLPIGFQTSIATLMKWGDETARLNAVSPIQNGEKLEVSVET